MATRDEKETSTGAQKALALPSPPILPSSISSSPILGTDPYLEGLLGDMNDELALQTDLLEDLLNHLLYSSESSPIISRTSADFVSSPTTQNANPLTSSGASSGPGIATQGTQSNQKTSTAKTPVSVSTTTTAGEETSKDLSAAKSIPTTDSAIVSKSAQSRAQNRSSSVPLADERGSTSEKTLPGLKEAQAEKATEREQQVQARAREQAQRAQERLLSTAQSQETLIGQLGQKFSKFQIQQEQSGKDTRRDFLGELTLGPLYTAGKEMYSLVEDIGVKKEKEEKDKKSTIDGKLATDQKNEKRAGAQRDAKGRFIQRQAMEKTEEQKEKLDDIEQTLEDNEAEEVKRHKQLIKAVKASGYSMLDALMSRGGFGGRNKKGVTPGKTNTSIDGLKDSKKKTKVDTPKTDPKKNVQADTPTKKDSGKVTKADTPNSKTAKPDTPKKTSGRALSLSPGTAAATAIAGKEAEDKLNNKQTSTKDKAQTGANAARVAENSRNIAQQAGQARKAARTSVTTPAPGPLPGGSTNPSTSTRANAANQRLRDAKGRFLPKETAARSTQGTVEAVKGGKGALDAAKSGSTAANAVKGTRGALQASNIARMGLTGAGVATRGTAGLLLGSNPLGWAITAGMAGYGAYDAITNGDYQRAFGPMEEGQESTIAQDVMMGVGGAVEMISFTLLEAEDTAKFLNEAPEKITEAVVSLPEAISNLPESTEAEARETFAVQESTDVTGGQIAAQVAGDAIEALSFGLLDDAKTAKSLIEVGENLDNLIQSSYTSLENLANESTEFMGSMLDKTTTELTSWFSFGTNSVKNVSDQNLLGTTSALTTTSEALQTSSSAALGSATSATILTLSNSQQALEQSALTNSKLVDTSLNASRQNVEESSDSTLQSLLGTFSSLTESVSTVSANAATTVLGSLGLISDQNRMNQAQFEKTQATSTEAMNQAELSTLQATTMVQSTSSQMQDNSKSLFQSLSDSVSSTAAIATTTILGSLGLIEDQNRNNEVQYSRTQENSRLAMDRASSSTQLATVAVETTSAKLQEEQTLLQAQHQNLADAQGQSLINQTAIVETLSSTLEDSLNSLGENISSLSTTIGNWVSDKAAWATQTLTATATSITETTAEIIEEIQESTVGEVAEEIGQNVGEVAGSIQTKADEFVSDLSETDAGQTIGELASKAGEELEDFKDQASALISKGLSLLGMGDQKESVKVENQVQEIREDVRETTERIERQTQTELQRIERTSKNNDRQMKMYPSPNAWDYPEPQLYPDSQVFMLMLTGRG